MKIIAFAGSNSSKSINHQLVSYAASLVSNTQVIKLTDYDMPIYSIDIEENKGIPEMVKALDKKLAEADKFIIAASEHNGNISAFFKNTLDWLSRNNRKFLENKKVVVLSTSPGKGGGATALQITQKTLPYFGAEIIASLSIGSFYDNFENGVLVNQEINDLLKEVVLKIG